MSAEKEKTEIEIKISLYMGLSASWPVGRHFTQLSPFFRIAFSHFAYFLHMFYSHMQTEFPFNSIARRGGNFLFHGEVAAA